MPMNSNTCGTCHMQSVRNRQNKRTSMEVRPIIFSHFRLLIVYERWEVRSCLFASVDVDVAAVVVAVVAAASSAKGNAIPSKNANLGRYHFFRFPSTPTTLAALWLGSVRYDLGKAPACKWWMHGHCLHAIWLVASLPGKNKNPPFQRKGRKGRLGGLGSNL